MTEEVTAEVTEEETEETEAIMVSVIPLIGVVTMIAKSRVVATGVKNADKKHLKTAGKIDVKKKRTAFKINPMKRDGRKFAKLNKFNIFWIFKFFSYIIILYNIFYFILKKVVVIC